MVSHRPGPRAGIVESRGILSRIRIISGRFSKTRLRESEFANRRKSSVMLDGLVGSCRFFNLCVISPGRIYWVITKINQLNNPSATFQTIAFVICYRYLNAYYMEFATCLKPLFLDPDHLFPRVFSQIQISERE